MYRRGWAWGPGVPPYRLGLGKQGGGRREEGGGRKEAPPSARGGKGGVASSLPNSSLGSVEEGGGLSSLGLVEEGGAGGDYRRFSQFNGSSGTERGLFGSNCRI